MSLLVEIGKKVNHNVHIQSIPTGITSAWLCDCRALLQAFAASYNIGGATVRENLERNYRQLNMIH